jgi:hypothetical protein
MLGDPQVNARRRRPGAPQAAVVAQASEKQPRDAAKALEEVDQLQLPVGWGVGNAPDDVGEDTAGTVPRGK